MRRCASCIAVLGVALTALAGSSSGGNVAAPAPPSGALLESLSQPPARAAIASQRIYFVMTDRYRNGDPSNDTGGLGPSKSSNGFDPSDVGFFHGGDFKGLMGDCTGPAGLARLKILGFTGVWVTPPMGQLAVQGDSAAYHGYWGINFDKVDAHLGTEKDFADFVACAHGLGMKVYMDMVVNHTANVVGLSPGGAFVEPAQRPYKDCKGKKFNPAAYVKKTFPCLSAAKSFPNVPFLAANEKNLKSPAWMNDVTNYHNRGDIDFNACSQACFEQGDFFGLDDLFTEKPVVLQGLADVYADWIRKYKLDGFRVDTAKHVNAAFFRLWAPKILAAARDAGVPDFEIFGEVTLNDAIELSSYVRDRGLPNVLDFPFQDAAAGYSTGRLGPGVLAERVRDDDYFRYTPKVMPTPVTFLGNHDMGRAAFQVKQHGASDAQLLQRLLLGYDVLYLLRGAPAVYYGDEVGMIGDGGDKAARQDMFPTQIDEWKTELRVGSPPIGNGSSFDVTTNPIELRLKELGALKDAHPALSTGATIVREVRGNILVVSRIDWSAKREYVVAFNSAATPSFADFQTSTPSSAWTPLLGSVGTQHSLSDGKMLGFGIAPMDAVVLEADAQISSPAPPTPTLKLGNDEFSSLKLASATVVGSAPVSVSFAIKRKPSSDWELLAADDSPPFRGFLDKSKFAKKQKIYLVAIARSAGGKTSVSKVVSLVPRPR